MGFCSFYLKNRMEKILGFRCPDSGQFKLDLRKNTNSSSSALLKSLSSALFKTLCLEQ